MAFRGPLAQKNIQTKAGSGAIKEGKKRRGIVPPVMDKSALVESLRKINDQYASPSCRVPDISEEYFTKPNPERVQLLYIMLLNVIFDITIDQLHQVPFGSTSDYPELYEDHHFRVNFLKKVHGLMDTCLPGENDFGPRDIIEPQPKRTQKHLSAICNFIKFREYINRKCKTEESKIKIQDLTKNLQEKKENEATLKQDIAILKEKKVSEKEIEDDLRLKIKDKKQNLKELESHTVHLEERLSNGKKNNKETKAKYDALCDEIQRQETRIADLSEQMVTSPQELYREVAEARELLQEATASTNEATETLAMWESLNKKASEIPPDIEQTIGDINELMDYVKKTDEKKKQLEQLTDTKIKMTQELKQMQFRIRNLTEEARGLAEERASLLQSTNSTGHHKELINELDALRIELETKKTRDNEILLELEEMKRKHAQREKFFMELNVTVEGQLTSLRDLFYKCKEKRALVSQKLIRVQPTEEDQH